MRSLFSLVFCAATFIFCYVASAQDYYAFRLFQFQHSLGSGISSGNQDALIRDTEKRVYIASGEEKKTVYVSMSDDSITIYEGREPIVFSGEQKKKILRGTFLQYREGAIQLFATSDNDIDYILIGYDTSARVSTIVHLKKK